MNFLAILPQYVRWHYTTALVDLGRLWKNILKFIYNFFSIPTLLGSLLSPWERMGDEHRKGESAEDWVKTIIFNTIMRGVGFVVRSMFIVMGIICLALGCLLGIGLYALWILLPVVWFKILLFGINELSH